MVGVIAALAEFARKHRDLPCLAYTHFQPAQPTTVGKRACLWAYDFVLDLIEIEHRLGQLKAPRLEGNHRHAGQFPQPLPRRPRQSPPLGGVDLPQDGLCRKLSRRRPDLSAKGRCAGFGRAVGRGPERHKMATDLRLLAHRKEVEEPFEEEQIGSSAMAYKRNPMRSERICSLARFLMGLEASSAQTAAVQWLERTLDDSAIRRLDLPQAFLAADAVLILCQNVAGGLVVYPKVIAASLEAELPFMATENILMAAVAAGGDRQDLHERIRRHSQAAAAVVKEQGGKNDLLERLAADAAFACVDLAAVVDPRQFIGRAPQQVDEFLAEVVAPILAKNPNAVRGDVEVKV